MPDINIGGMQVSRDEAGGQALIALTVDSAIPADVLARAQQLALDGEEPGRVQPARLGERGLDRKSVV